MFNQITLVGNLTRDIELKYTQGGVAIANTAIATSHKFTSNGEKKEEVCFVDITAFGKTGEVMNQYLRKGSKVLIVGRLKFDQWNDQQGQRRSKHTVSIETMKMLDSKQDTQTNQQQMPQQQQSYQTQQQQQQTQYQKAQGQNVSPHQYQQTQQQMPQQPAALPIDDNDVPF